MNQKIRTQILKVRDSGKSNMLDIKNVQYHAYHMNLYELVNYLEDRKNRNEYWHFIMTGEAPMEDAGNDEIVPEEDEDDDTE